MRNLLLSVALAACLASGANAHVGMIALFSDANHSDCSMGLAAGQSGSMYLMYVRGEGPVMGHACEFKLLKSTPDAIFLAPVWAPNIVTDIILGTIETGISITSVDCFPAGDYVYLGTIPLMNVADPDTFSVKVVADPLAESHEIVITKCEPMRFVHVVAGGTFFFNRACYSPEDPYGTIGVEPTTWGAIRDLYR